jgi:hypothetical protein
MPMERSNIPTAVPRLGPLIQENAANEIETDPQTSHEMAFTRSIRCGGPLIARLMATSISTTAISTPQSKTATLRSLLPIASSKTVNLAGIFPVCTCPRTQFDRSTCARNVGFSATSLPVVSFRRLVVEYRVYATPFVSRSEKLPL